jgi:hypothetical protein
LVGPVDWEGQERYGPHPIDTDTGSPGEA